MTYFTNIHTLDELKRENTDALHLRTIQTRAEMSRQ